MNKLKYRELQKLAKEHDIDARNKKQVLVKKLENLLLKKDGTGSTSHTPLINKCGHSDSANLFTNLNKRWKDNNLANDEDSILNTTFEISPGESSIFAPNKLFSNNLQDNNSTPVLLNSKRKIDHLNSCKTRRMTKQLCTDNNVLSNIDTNKLNTNSPLKIKLSGKNFKKALLESLENMVKTQNDEIMKNVNVKIEQNLNNLRTFNGQVENPTIFDKMENIFDYQTRKNNKAKQYKNLWKRDKMLMRNTPDDRNLKKAFKGNGKSSSKYYENPLPLPLNNIQINFKFEPPVFGGKELCSTMQTTLSNRRFENKRRSTRQAKPPSSVTNNNKFNDIIPKKIAAIPTKIISSATLPMFLSHVPALGPSSAFYDANTKLKSINTPFYKTRKINERIPDGSVLKKRLAYDPQTSLRLTKRAYTTYKGPVKPLKKSPKLPCCQHDFVTEQRQIQKRSRGRPPKKSKQVMAAPTASHPPSKIDFLDAVASKMFHETYKK